MLHFLQAIFQKAISAIAGIILATGMISLPPQEQTAPPKTQAIVATGIPSATAVNDTEEVKTEHAETLNGSASSDSKPAERGKTYKLPNGATIDEKENQIKTDKKKYLDFVLANSSYNFDLLKDISYVGDSL